MIQREGNWQARLSDAAKMLQLGGAKLPKHQDQIEARAEFNANLAAQLQIKIDQNTDQLTKVIALLGDLVALQGPGRVVVREYTYVNRGVLGTDTFDLVVPDGDWLLERMITLATSPAGISGSPNVGMIGLFGRNVMWGGTTIGADTNIFELNVPITTRRLEFTTSTILAAGATVTYLFVLRQVGE